MKSVTIHNRYHDISPTEVCRLGVRAAFMKSGEENVESKKVTRVVFFFVTPRVYLAPAVGRYMREDGTYGESKWRCMLRKEIEDVLLCRQDRSAIRSAAGSLSDSTRNRVFACSSRSRPFVDHIR